MNFEATIDAIAEKVPKAGETYLGEDGLLYCSKCNKKVQTRIKFNGSEKTVRCICKCEEERRQAEEAARSRAERMQRVEGLRKAGFCESDMENWTFENDDGTNIKLKNALKAYVMNFDIFKSKGKGLLLWGAVGTGKTFGSACIANALIEDCRPVLMTSFPRLVNTLQGMFEGRQQYIDSLNRFDLLIIDDLGAERKTEFMQEIVYSIIDSRYRAGLPMIITTNLTLEEIKNPVNVTEARYFDRILERCHPIEVNGTSHRRKRIIEDFAETKEMLGL